MSKTFYLTTPIYYVNGRPHIGHAYTTIAADTLARHHRMKGEEVFLLTGTDEHGQKVLASAAKRGRSPQEHCDDLVLHWKAMWERLDIGYQRFIRTTDEDHVAAVQWVLKKLWDEGFIYMDEYTGWYSVSAERFWTEKDLVDGRCPDTGQPVEELTEKNYFFKMGGFQQRLLDHIEAHPDFIRPESRRNEVLGFLKQDLADLCISRPKTRMSWGIELPFDQDYVTYVWFDALLNYASAVGYGANAGETWEKWWPAQYHLIGKDILTTHTVYWSTMLMALEVPLTECVYAHGWWTSTDGQKMSKSLGNAIDINLLIDEFGSDASRYFFLREKSFAGDGGFSYEGFLTRYNADLANDLGNLAQRALSMTSNWLGGQVPPAVSGGVEEAELAEVGARAVSEFDRFLLDLQFNRALESLWELVRAANRYLEIKKPWESNKTGSTEDLQRTMRTSLEVCNVLGTCLLSTLPGKAPELLGRLGRNASDAAGDYPAILEQANAGALELRALSEGAAIDLGDALFPRFRKMPAPILALFEPEEEPEKKVPEPPPAPKKSETVATGAEPARERIGIEDFGKVQLRVGRITNASAHPSADRLLVLTVDVGEDAPRSIVAGIAEKFSPETLVGRNVVVVANLKPAKLRGVVSQGMLLVAQNGDQMNLLNPGDLAPGSKIS